MQGESEHFNQQSYIYYTSFHSLDIKYSGSIISYLFLYLNLKYSGGALGPHEDFMQDESEHYYQLSHTYSTCFYSLDLKYLASILSYIFI